MVFIVSPCKTICMFLEIRSLFPLYRLHFDDWMASRGWPKNSWLVLAVATLFYLLRNRCWVVFHNKSLYVINPETFLLLIPGLKKRCSAQSYAEPTGGSHMFPPMDSQVIITIPIPSKIKHYELTTPLPQGFLVLHTIWKWWWLKCQSLQGYCSRKTPLSLSFHHCEDVYISTHILDGPCCKES